ncbi:phage minor capsid protein [Dactylosporangium salmoneum]|uniref:Minor capsid protein n=1 Tax=Dactylosporangium salmoneum TaxID=53361 RepID=A0ABN3FCW8_9ACTN
MPVSRTLAEDLAANLADLYADVERQLAAEVARRLAAGMPAPTWAADKLAALATLRRWAERLLQQLTGRQRDQIAQAIVLAYVRGGREALDELARQQIPQLHRLALGNQVAGMARLSAVAEQHAAAIWAEATAVRAALPGVDALQVLAFNLASTLQGTHLPVLRWALDAYRTVVARAAAPVLLGTLTRRQAAQQAWEQLLGQGITGFVDSRGRRWNLASYVEMAVRTTTAHAAVQGHLDRLGQAGIDLVIVSDAPQECILCRPWEGKVLARVGPPGARTVRLEHATRDGELVDVHIAGSVAEAIAAGLMHPNCRHSLSIYLPGVTRIPHHTADPEGDRARQQLRYLERGVRAWKLRAAAAIDPAASDRARAKVRAWQARIRAHVATTGLRRHPEREQIGAAR